MPAALHVEHARGQHGATQNLDGFSGGHLAASRVRHAAQCMQEKLVQQERLVFLNSPAPEKLACMSIHSEIKRRRVALGWSYERLADEVSKLEGLQKPLSWQAVQQWEREDGTAPKRKRLEFVARALGTYVESLIDKNSPPPTAAEPPPRPWLQLPGAVEQVVAAIADLTPSAWAMARAAMDTVVGHPEMRNEVTASLLLVLQAAPTKRAQVG